MKRALLTLIVLASVGGGSYWYVTHRRAPTPSVPTYAVKQERLLRQVSAEGNLRAVKAERLVVPKSGGGFGPKKVAWLAPDGARVEKGAIVVKFDRTDPEQELVEGESDLQSADAQLASERVKGKAAVAQRDSAAALAGKELEQSKQFQSKDETIFSRNEIIESEIDEGLAGAKQEHAEGTKAVERQLSKSKSGLIEVEQQKAQLAIAHAKTALDSMELRAPDAGLFVLTRNWRGEMPRIGEQLWPGQPVGEIPRLDTMEVQVFVLEIDGNGLAEGQPADVVVEAHPDTTYHGKISKVEKLAKPRIGTVPVQYFEVIVELEQTDASVMKPGQRVSAKLTLADEQALVVPRQAVQNKDGKSFVYRRDARGDFEQVPVELGASTSGRVAVASGLAAGDVIALRDPTRSLDQALGSGSDDVVVPSGQGAPGGGGP